MVLQHVFEYFIFDSFQVTKICCVEGAVTHKSSGLSHVARRVLPFPQYFVYVQYMMDHWAGEIYNGTQIASFPHYYGFQRKENLAEKIMALDPTNCRVFLRTGRQRGNCKVHFKDLDTCVSI